MFALPCPYFFVRSRTSPSSPAPRAAHRAQTRRVLIVLDGLVERFDLRRVEDQRFFWVRHGGMHRVPEHRERPRKVIHRA